jgi:hypothetical protein
VVGWFAVLWSLPAVWALVACLAGRGARSEGARWLSGRLTALLVCSTILALLFFVGAGDMAFAQRAVLGAMVLGAAAAPTVAFYALGYAVRRGRLVGGLWFVGTLPLAAYTGLALLAFLTYSFCSTWDCPGGPD